MRYRRRKIKDAYIVCLQFETVINMLGEGIDSYDS